jgi:hypothetical protein
MNNLESSLLLVLLIVVAGLAGTVGYTLGAADAPVHEVVRYMPAVRQPDQSLIAERVPDPDPPPPPHRLPAGTQEVRRVATTARPHEGTTDVRINWSLIRDDAGGQRVVVSSPDAAILGAIDTPIIPALIPAPPRLWAAGVSYDPAHDRPGAWVERDLGPIRVGADVLAAEHGGVRALVRVGWRF